MTRPQPIAPGPGQESVWDYPRPPLIESCAKAVRIEANGVVVAGSDRALRVLETAGPPTIYIPSDDVQMQLLTPATLKTSYCEWKGRASYFDVADRKGAAWTYPAPKPAFAALRGFISFYPGKLECYLDEERVRPQPGRFYGGWITDEIVGPFKGEPGSLGW